MYESLIPQVLVTRPFSGLPSSMAQLTRLSSWLEAQAPSGTDVLFALAVTVFAQLDLRFNLDNSTQYGSPAAASLFGATATMALAWRRRSPRATALTVAGAVAIPELVTVLTTTLWGHLVPLLIACYSAARWGGRRTTVVATTAGVLAIAIILVRVPSTTSLSNVPFTLVPLATLVIIGRSLRLRDTRARALAEEAALLREAQARALASAIDDERNRIARELHDIIAHCVTVMVVQSRASEALIRVSPDRAVESLHAVQRTGEQAIGELHRMLGLLRGATPENQPVAPPQPTTAVLPDLFTRVTSAGVPVELRTEGTPRELAPGIDLAVYRVIQEALTNTIKHAGSGARATVRLCYRPDAIEVTVDDTGLGPTGIRHDARHTGHGLVGMAERVALYGGSVSARARAGGGFRVHVTLPVDRWDTR